MPGSWRGIQLPEDCLFMLPMDVRHYFLSMTASPMARTLSKVEPEVEPTTAMPQRSEIHAQRLPRGLTNKRGKFDNAEVHRSCHTHRSLIHLTFPSQKCSIKPFAPSSSHVSVCLPKLSDHYLPTVPSAPYPTLTTGTNSHICSNVHSCIPLT